MNNTTIAVEGIKIFAYHGFYEIERKIGNDFTIDIYVTMPAGHHDHEDMAHTIDYEQIIRVCKEQMNITSHLLEDVADRIVQKIRQLTSMSIEITVRISKHHPMLTLSMDRFYVERRSSK